jgi:hypothetical protein
MFIQSGRHTGIGDNGAEQIYICPNCGRFTIHARSNGEHITIEFELCIPEHIEAAGKYMKYMEWKAAIDMRLYVIQQQYEMGNLSQDEAFELLRGPLSPDNPETIYDDSSRLKIINFESVA